MFGFGKAYDSDNGCDATGHNAYGNNNEPMTARASSRTSNDTSNSNNNHRNSNNYDIYNGYNPNNNLYNDSYRTKMNSNGSSSNLNSNSRASDTKTNLRYESRAATASSRSNSGNYSHHERNERNAVNSSDKRNNSSSSSYSSSSRSARSPMTSNSNISYKNSERKAAYRKKMIERRRSYNLDNYNNENDSNNNININNNNNMTCEQMEARCNELKKSNSATLDRALATAYQTEEVAGDTMEKLHYQGKQLKNIDKMLHETNENLDQTQHILTGMKSIFGQVSNWFKKAPKYNKYDGNDGANDRNSKDLDNKSKSKNNNRNGNARFEEQVLESKSMGNDGNKEENAKLDELLKSVKNMRVMACDINEELHSQSELIDRIDNKMDIVDEKMKNQNFTMRRIG